MKESFAEWHKELKRLADDRGCGFLVPPADDYPTDGYDCGDSPAVELDELISCCDWK